MREFLEGTAYQLVPRMKGKVIFRRPASRVQVAIDTATASSDCGVRRLVWYDECDTTAAGNGSLLTAPGDAHRTRIQQLRSPRFTSQPQNGP